MSGRSGRRARVAVWLAVSAECLFATGPAAATPSVDGRIRLSLEGRVLDHRAFTASAEGSPDVSTSQTTFGLASSSFGPGLAYGLSELAVLGARVSFISSERSWDDDVLPSETQQGLGLYASLELVPGSDSIRPFVAPMLGYESLTAESGDVELSSSATVFGLQAGLHGFATDSFSIDPSVTLAYATGNTRLGTFDSEESGLVVGIGFALSGRRHEGTRAARRARSRDGTRRNRAAVARQDNCEVDIAPCGVGEVAVDSCKG